MNHIANVASLTTEPNFIIRELWLFTIYLTKTKYSDIQCMYEEMLFYAKSTNNVKPWPDGYYSPTLAFLAGMCNDLQTISKIVLTLYPDIAWGTSTGYFYKYVTLSEHICATSRMKKFLKSPIVRVTFDHNVQNCASRLHMEKFLDPTSLKTIDLTYKTFSDMFTHINIF